MFGYRLILVKKEDLKEYEVFKNLVPKMKNFIDDFSKLIQKGIEIGPDMAYVLTSESNILSTMIDIYFNNKYSNPSSSMMLYRHLSSFQTNVKRMLDLFIKFEQLHVGSLKKREELVNQGLDDDGIQEYDEHVQMIIDEGINRVSDTATKMLENLRHIKCCILSDYTRLNMGVDIMKEYNRRIKKESLSEKDFMNEFTVRFKVLSNSDRQFIEKEKLKNERSRNGTTNGGLSEKI